MIDVKFVNFIDSRLHQQNSLNILSIHEILEEHIAILKENLKIYDEVTSSESQRDAWNKEKKQADIVFIDNLISIRDKLADQLITAGKVEVEND